LGEALLAKLVVVSNIASRLSAFEGFLHTHPTWQGKVT
jgi:trehalose-6-phosphate synthase